MLDHVHQGARHDEPLLVEQTRPFTEDSGGAEANSLDALLLGGGEYSDLGRSLVVRGVFIFAPDGMIHGLSICVISFYAGASCNDRV